MQPCREGCAASLSNLHPRHITAIVTTLQSSSLCTLHLRPLRGLCSLAQVLTSILLNRDRRPLWLRRSSDLVQHEHQTSPPARGHISATLTTRNLKSVNSTLPIRSLAVLFWSALSLLSLEELTTEALAKHQFLPLPFDYTTFATYIPLEERSQKS
jgi:hypothetical protein